MKSIWKKTTVIPARGPLCGDLNTQVAVIGGGMAGILTAFYLQRQGMQVVVLEAERMGSGQTENTTAKITSQHGMIYHKLISTVGIEKAKQYARANQKAVSEYRRLIRGHSINCHFEERPAYLYSLERSEPLRKEADSAAKLGLPAQFVTETELPFPIHGAVKFDKQAQFHPLEFLKGISEDLTVYEHTRVLSVKGACIQTDHGKVRADHVIFACHFPFVNAPGFYFVKMYQERSYVIALANTQKLNGMYLGAGNNGYSFRSAGDLLLLGHGSHRTGKIPKDNPYKRLESTARHLWINSTPVANWSAEDCITFDKIPYIGRFGASTPRWYVATGFNKWGMTSSMVSAMILSDMILGRHSPYGEVFSPQRFFSASSAVPFVSHAIESVKGLTLGVTPGVPRCPHLGCRLSWNPADRRWECPCHGSVFKQNGEILYDPAQTNIPFIHYK